MNKKKRHVAFPFYLLGFVAMAVLNSTGFFSQKIVELINKFSLFLLVISMAAIGLETDIGLIKRVGMRPFILGAIATILIAGISYVLVRVL